MVDILVHYEHFLMDIDDKAGNIGHGDGVNCAADFHSLLDSVLPSGVIVNPSTIGIFHIYPLMSSNMASWKSPN